MTSWQLPTYAVIGGQKYPINADYRDVLNLLRYIKRPDLPDYMCWQIVLALFYEGEIPQAHQEEAAQWLADFLNGGEPEEKTPDVTRPVLDWEGDASMIVAEVNKVAGQEIRALPFVHWWTFLAWFNGIGEGRLATVVSIREKKANGKKLEKWEQQYYAKNKKTIDMKRRYTAEEQAERDRLLALLGK